MTEKQLHKQICNYIKLQYPNVLFNTDMSGIKLTIGQGVQAKSLRSSNGFPDIVIYEPVFDKESGHIVFCGLFLEIKKESPFKKDGTLKKNVHLKEQYDLMIKLGAKKYLTSFVWDFDTAKFIIDKYLKNYKK